MNNQILNVQIQADNRAVYVKPSLENHPSYKAITAILGGSFRPIGDPVNIISDPGLELIPDPVDIGI